MATEKKSRGDLDSKLQAVKFLLEAFKLERFVYLIICCVSIGMLIVVALMQLNSGKADTAMMIGLFMPTGALAYSVGRILKMWNQALLYIANEKLGEENK